MSNQDKEAAWKLIQQAIKNEKSVSPRALQIAWSYKKRKIDRQCHTLHV